MSNDHLHRTPEHSSTTARRGRTWWIGLVLGALVPLAAFALPWLNGDTPALGGPGDIVWSAVAFGGVLLTAFRRTRQLGVGILIGFAGLLLIGAGTCTTILMTHSG